MRLVTQALRSAIADLRVAITIAASAYCRNQFQAKTDHRSLTFYNREKSRLEFVSVGNQQTLARAAQLPRSFRRQCALVNISRTNCHPTLLEALGFHGL
jgi:hypothetical protein